MPSDLLKRRIGDIAAFLIPLVLVKVAAVAIVEGAPPGARGAVAATPIEPVELHFSTTSSSFTPEQFAASQHLDALKDEPFGDPPFYYRIRSKSGDPVMVDPIGNPDGDAPEIKVQMIMAARGGGSALINGKLYKVGDELKGLGLRLVEVDGVAYEVILEDLRSAVRKRFPLDRPR